MRGLRPLTQSPVNCLEGLQAFYHSLAIKVVLQTHALFNSSPQERGVKGGKDPLKESFETVLQDEGQPIDDIEDEEKDGKGDQEELVNAPVLLSQLLE